MNILIITSTFIRWKDDTESPIILNIAKNLIKHNSNIKIIVLAPHCDKAKKKEFIKKIKIYRFKYFINKWEKLCYQGGMLANINKNKLFYFLIPFFFIFQILAIKKIVKKEKIDIIHARWLIPQGLSAVLYKHIFNKNIKIVCSILGGDINNLNNKIFNILKKYIIKNVNIITSISHPLAKLIKNNFHIKALVMHNGIDTDLFCPSYNNQTFFKKKYNINSFCILFVGHLIEEKGIKYLIDACISIKLVFPKIKLLIIGDGPQKNNFKKLVKKLNLKKNIIFINGMTNEKLINYYNLADVFIGPSIKEGFGMVFLEALACGTPVIASNVGGIPDIVINNKTGILIPKKNSNAISNAVLYLLKNKKIRNKLSYTGKNFVKNNFSWKKITQDYYNLYKKIL